MLGFFLEEGIGIVAMKVPLIQFVIKVRKGCARERGEGKGRALWGQCCIAN